MVCECPASSSARVFANRMVRCKNTMALQQQPCYEPNLGLQLLLPLLLASLLRLPLLHKALPLLGLLSGAPATSLAPLNHLPSPAEPLLLRHMLEQPMTMHTKPAVALMPLGIDHDEWLRCRCRCRCNALPQRCASFHACMA